MKLSHVVAVGLLVVSPVVADEVVAMPGEHSETPSAMAFSYADQNDPDVDVVSKASGLWRRAGTWNRPFRDNNGDGVINVIIRDQDTVTVDRDIPQQLNTVRVGGDLRVRSNVEGGISMSVGTIHVSSTGSSDPASLRIGVGADGQMEAHRGRAPIEVSFHDDEIVGVADAMDLGRGLVAQGNSEVQMLGEDKVDSLVVTHRSSLAAGSGSIRVGRTRPQNWRYGDQIVVAPTRFADQPDANSTENEDRAQFFEERSESEVFAVRAVRQQNGFWFVDLGRPDDTNRAATLQHDHQNYSGYGTHVANLTRNVVLRSEDTTNVDVNQDLRLGENGAALGQSELVPNRGHVMLNSFDVNIENAWFQDLGRTNKKIAADKIIPGSPAGDTSGDGIVNIRGRYSLHFHRNLDLLDDAFGGRTAAKRRNSARVVGSSVVGSPGWGYVSHSSNVDFVDNVSYDVDGSAFHSEAGDEIGTWTDNVAIEGTGDGVFLGRRFEGGSVNRDQASQLGRVSPYRHAIANGDLGSSGVGFWIQSPGLDVTNNVAAGMDGRGFAIWTQGNVEYDTGNSTAGIEAGFRTEYIDDDGNWPDEERYLRWTAGNRSDIDDGTAVVQVLSMKNFEGNTAYASYIGLEIRYHNTANRTASLVNIAPGSNTEGVGARNRLQTLEPSRVANMTVLDSEHGIRTSYSDGVQYIGPVLLNEDEHREAFAALKNVGGIVIDSPVVRGYDQAFSLGVDVENEGRNPDRVDSWEISDPDVVVAGNARDRYFIRYGESGPAANDVGLLVRAFRGLNPITQQNFPG